MKEYYRHTQVGYFVILSLSVPIILVAIFMYVFEVNVFSVLVLVAFSIILGLFVTMTTVVDDKFIKIRFGPGVVRKRFPLNEVQSLKVNKNPWYCFGIQNTPDGLLFSVSGISALEIRMKDGKIYKLGSDNPQKLEKAIKEALGEIQ